MFEAAKDTKFANDGHGGDFLKSFTGHERVDDGLPLPGIQEGFHVFFEPFDTVDGLEVFFEDDLVSLIRKGEFTEVTHVSGSPFGFARVVEAIAEEEGVEALIGASEVVARISPGSADITDRLIESGRHSNVGDVAIAEELGDLAGIAFVRLDLFVGFAFGFGRSHDDARDLELLETSSEDEAGGTSFVTDVEILHLFVELLGQGTKGAFDSQVGA